jgi:HK97 family phage major capsid protein
MKNFKELEEKKNDLIERATVIVNGAESEKRELTDDEAQELAEIRDDVKKIKEELATLELIKDETKDETKDEGEKMEEKNKMDVEKAEERAFDAYVRGIVLNERAGELTKGANGAVIPTTIVNKIIKKVYDICPILEYSTKYNVKGKLEIPHYTETAENAITVAFANEFEDLTSNVGTFSKIELDGYLAGALTLISRSLINNSQFNLVEFIVSHMAYAIKRFIEDKLLNGATGKITGLTTAPTAVTAEASTVITADEIIRLHDSIKDDFQNDAIWIMSPATRTALRTLTSTTGYYLLNDDISTPFGSSLLGKPVYVSDNMPDMEAGKTAIYYGDMKGLATKFAKEMEIEVLREKYATQHAVGVVGWLEFDGKMENDQMVKKLVMKA